MPIDLKVPTVGESITEVQIGEWRKKEGDWVEKDETVVEIESDKATVELPSPSAGVLGKLLKQRGDTANVGETIGYVDEGKGKPAKGDGDAQKAAPAAVDRPAAPSQATVTPVAGKEAEKGAAKADAHVMPAARRAMAEQGVTPDQVQGSGPGGRVLKEDVARQVVAREQKPAATGGALAPARAPSPPTIIEARGGSREEELVPMSPIRRKIAERLVKAQQEAALLTTFNEIDMSAIVALRQEHKDSFQQRYGVKLGFMSFFIKAAIEALRFVPQVNNEIRGTDIVHRYYYDIGVAVGGGKGLLVPVLRNAERMTFGELEMAIADFGRRAQENKIKLEELQGGTFTISNGGVYGSLLSTPIVNPPQSGILGLHAIQERPVARDGAVVIRPMMYVALTYDHRLVDGREAVSFLKRIKECIEVPSRLLLEI